MSNEAHGGATSDRMQVRLFVVCNFTASSQVGCLQVCSTVLCSYTQYHPHIGVKTEIKQQVWQHKPKTVTSSEVRINNLSICFYFGLIFTILHKKNFYFHLSDRNERVNVFISFQGNLEPFDSDGWGGSELITPAGARLAPSHTFMLLTYTHSSSFLRFGRKKTEFLFPAKWRGLFPRLLQTVPGTLPWKCVSGKVGKDHVLMFLDREASAETLWLK